LGLHCFKNTGASPIFEAVSDLRNVLVEWVAEMGVQTYQVSDTLTFVLDKTCCISGM